MVVRTPDNLCIICGAQIPEGRMVCPMCGSSEGETFAKAMARPIHKDELNGPLAKAATETALKLKDEIEQAFRQGYTTGFNEGMKAACELKQQNEQLRRRIVVLENQARNTVDDIDGEFE